jgi:hypothetical protein
MQSFSENVTRPPQDEWKKTIHLLINMETKNTEGEDIPRLLPNRRESSSIKVADP